MRLAIALSALLATPALAQAPALLPTPAAMRVEGVGFRLAAGTPLIARDAGERNAAARLAELMGKRGVRLPSPAAAGSGSAVRFRRTAGFGTEAYRLATGADGAVIEASDDAGLLYGAVTLWQLADTTGRVPGVRIDDRPRFPWRGLMLDSARHFQSPAYIRRLIDAMAASKLNRLHWHLVDDQGWRLEIKRYPRLTSVGAWRRPATAPGAPPLARIGGFYTQDQVRALVAYAAARGVTIVPEIEMPGHALSAIRAYPALGTGAPVPPGVEAHWGVFPWLYNVEEPTFAFLQNVLTEVIALFPGRDIHIGGDEATKEQWRASPAVQARLRALGLKDEEALQGWFMARIGRFLARHGRRAIGWDEILEGGVPADVAITSWRGVEGAIKAAKAGHDAILSPAPTLYIDHRQGVGPGEPPGRGNPITLADVLAFDPVPAGLTPAQQRRILGLQANLWTEHVRDERRAAWMTFPRALAIAETGWAGWKKRDVATWAAPLLAQVDRLRWLGIGAADSAFAVTGRVELAGAALTATLATQSTLPVRYTIDGSVPTIASRPYAGPIALEPGQRLRAATFLGARALAGGYDRTVTLVDARVRTSRELTLCTNKVALDLEDDHPQAGPRARFLIDIFNPCWRWDAAPAARRIALHVGQVPFNFQVGADRDGIRFRPPATTSGEFEVRAGGCEGAPIATLPLAPAVRRPGVTRLEAVLPPANARDLCFTYTARGVDPLWAIERVELLP